MGLRFPEQWPGPPCLRLVSGAACELGTGESRRGIARENRRHPQVTLSRPPVNIYSGADTLLAFSEPPPTQTKLNLVMIIFKILQNSYKHQRK